jgi:P4 family phage/plasmid primase-like protien
MAVTDNGGVEKSHPAIEFLKALFGETGQQIFLQTLANDGDDPDEGPNKRHLMSRDIGAIERFVAKHDRARRGMFVCVATIAEGASTRSKDNCRELVCIHQDLDFKGITETEAGIWAAIAKLEAQPSIVVRSGGGLHLYWLLREPLDAQAHRDAVDLLLRQLAEIVAGDTATCEIARLMRLPGTVNSKYGDMREVTIERCDGALRYELEGLAEWVSYQRPVLTRKPPSVVQQAKTKQPRNVVHENPFLAAAAAMGRQPRLDVEEALAAMGQGNIHDTQVRVSASLLARGEAVEDVVSILMEATRQAIGSDAAKWNWRAEEKRIRTACAGAIRKFPPTPPRDAVKEDEPEIAHLDTDNVADLAAARARRQTPPKPRRGKVNHLDIGAILLEGWKNSGQGIVFTQTQGAWRYFDGLWRLQDDRTLRAWLDPQIEQCIRGTEAKSRNSLVSETRGWIIRHPDLQIDEAPFDRHGKVPTRSGLVDPVTGQLEPPHASQWCTWRVEVDYEPAAACPWWLKMLEDVLSDRPDDVRAEYIELLQEMLGAGLIDAKPRSLSKALIFQGGSNAGKSGLLEVMAGLFGAEQNTASLDTLDGAHGLVPFMRRMPWVLHEAFDQRKWHFSSTVKAIITGEPIQINVKNGPMLSGRFTAPVLWGTNNPPQFQEASKAIVSRIVVVKCRVEFDENRPVGAAAEALRMGLHRPSTLVLDRELPGLLAWALAGLRRALARGYFDQPEAVLEVAHEVRLDSNLVAGFVEDCVDFDTDMMVSTADFCAAFSSWWSEHKGENRGIPSNESIGRALAALGDARIAANRKELRTMAVRYYAGIRLNEAGLKYWNIAVTSDLFKGKTTSATASGKPINLPIPAAWDLKPAIEDMRMAHAKKGGNP